MDLDNANKQLPKLDELLTGLGEIGKKHWGKMIIIVLLALGYWFFTLVAEETEAAVSEPEPIEWHEDDYSDNEQYQQKSN